MKLGISVGIDPTVNAISLHHKRCLIDTLVPLKHHYHTISQGQCIWHSDSLLFDIGIPCVFLWSTPPVSPHGLSHYNPLFHIVQILNCRFCICSKGFFTGWLHITVPYPLWEWDNPISPLWDKNRVWSRTSYQDQVNHDNNLSLVLLRFTCILYHCK